MRRIYVIFGALLLGAPMLVGDSKPQRPPFDYRPLERVLAKYLDAEGRVDYAALKQNRHDLDEMIERISSVSPDSAPELFPTREAKLAYWINAYNAWILRIVVDNYPTTSITKIGMIPYGAFFVKRVRLGGSKMTLRSLENDIVRGRFHDPRIHFAINCASASCPPLRNRVYLAETLDQQLDAATRAFINDPRHVKLDAAGNRIELSKIFDWYASDFTEALGSKSGGKRTVADYLKGYLNDERRQVLEKLPQAKVSYQEYDWNLNDQAQAVARGSSR
ncbi:MAG: DUF547 domain-containing protein [Acidobacteria bacterium]|nr:DUF547 domain-containing protein [Acidobacteriota bacterium]